MYDVEDECLRHDCVPANVIFGSGSGTQRAGRVWGAKWRDQDPLSEGKRVTGAKEGNDVYQVEQLRQQVEVEQQRQQAVQQQRQQAVQQQRQQAVQQQKASLQNAGSP